MTKGAIQQNIFLNLDSKGSDLTLALKAHCHAHAFEKVITNLTNL